MLVGSLCPYALLHCPQHLAAASVDDAELRESASEERVFCISSKHNSAPAMEQTERINAVFLVEILRRTSTTVKLGSAKALTFDGLCIAAADDAKADSKDANPGSPLLFLDLTQTTIMRLPGPGP